MILGGPQAGAETASGTEGPAASSAGETEFLSGPQKDRGCENLSPEDARGHFPAAWLLLHNEIVPLNVQESVGAPGFVSPRQKVQQIVLIICSSVALLNLSSASMGNRVVPERSLRCRPHPFSLYPTFP